MMDIKTFDLSGQTLSINDLGTVGLTGDRQMNMNVTMKLAAGSVGGSLGDILEKDENGRPLLKFSVTGPMANPKVKFDFKEVAFAHISNAKPFIADVHGLLEALQVLLREFQGRFSQQNIDKLLTNIEDQLALAIRDLGAHHGGLILRGL